MNTRIKNFGKWTTSKPNDICESAMSKYSKAAIERFRNQFPDLGIDEIYTHNDEFSVNRKRRWMWMITGQAKNGHRMTVDMVPQEASVDWIIDRLWKRVHDRHDEVKKLRLNQGLDGINKDWDWVGDMGEEITESVLNDSHWRKPKVFHMKH